MKVVNTSYGVLRSQVSITPSKASIYAPGPDRKVDARKAPPRPICGRARPFRLLLIFGVCANHPNNPYNNDVAALAERRRVQQHLRGGDLGASWL